MERVAQPTVILRVAIGLKDHVAPSMAIVETIQLTVGLAARVDLATRRQFRPSKVPL